MKKKVIFISGLSGTGKTTLVNYFKEHPLPGFSFFDFDRGKFEPPPPKDSHLEWRTKQNNWWLEAAHQEFEKEKKISVIMGLSLYPRQIPQLPNAKYFSADDIHFGLLVCDPKQRKKRLYDRDTPHHWRGYDHPWHAEFHEENRAAGALEIDTSCASVEETAGSIRDWLRSLIKASAWSSVKK